MCLKKVYDSDRIFSMEGQMLNSFATIRQNSSNNSLAFCSNADLFSQLGERGGRKEAMKERETSRSELF